MNVGELAMKATVYVLTLWWLHFLATPDAHAAERPNVLLLVADDLRAELGCLGSGHVQSPHLDRLAERSRVFTRAYCQQAVCNPSRASFLTGLRPNTLKVWDLRRHFRKRFPDRPTLPQLFEQFSDGRYRMRRSLTH